MKSKKEYRAVKFKILRFVLFLFVLLGINEAICLTTIPGYSISRFQNHDISKDKNKYEVLIFGASDALIDPKVAEDILKKPTFNCGTFGTYYMGGQIYSTFLNAVTFQKPDMVILCVADCNMDNSDDLEKNQSFGASSYHYYAKGMKNIVAKMQAYIRTSRYDSAIEKIFEWKTQWIENYTENTLDSIKNNTKLLFEKGYWTYDEAWREGSDPRNKNYYRGYCPEKQHEWIENEKQLEQQKFNGKYPDYSNTYIDGCDIEDISKYCNKNGIRLVIIPSVTSKYTIAASLNDRIDFWAKTKKLAEQCHAEYYNPNLYKEEFVEFIDSDFADGIHFNDVGSKKYTESICVVLNGKEANKDVEHFFYSDINEWLESFYNRF